MGTFGPNIEGVGFISCEIEGLGWMYGANRDEHGSGHEKQCRQRVFELRCGRDNMEGAWTSFSGSVEVWVSGLDIIM
jgi:hypothetical protein